MLGIVPFNPNYVVSRAPTIPHTPRHSPKSAQSPLLSLSVENREFIRTHRPPLDSPENRRLISLSSSLESSTWEKMLLSKENAEQRDVIHKRKKPRRAITVPHLGTHHSTTPQVLEQVQVLEAGMR